MIICILYIGTACGYPIIVIETKSFWPPNKLFFFAILISEKKGWIYGSQFGGFLSHGGYSNFSKL